MAAVLALLSATPALAAPSLQDATVGQTVAAMKPGDFLWAPDVAPAGPVVIVVSIAQQRAYAYRNGVPIGISTVSTGRCANSGSAGLCPARPWLSSCASSCGETACAMV